MHGNQLAGVPAVANTGAATVGEALATQVDFPVVLQAPRQQDDIVSEIFGLADSNSNSDDDTGLQAVLAPTDAAQESQAVSVESYHDGGRGDRTLDAACYEMFTRIPGRLTQPVLDMIDAYGINMRRLKAILNCTCRTNI